MRNKIEKWERLRAKGKWNYIFVYGVLLWGVSTAMAFSVIFALTMGAKVSFLRVLALSLALFPLGGVVWGYFNWTLSQKAYEKATMNEREDAADAHGPRRT